MGINWVDRCLVERIGRNTSGWFRIQARSLSGLRCCSTRTGTRGDWRFDYLRLLGSNYHGGRSEHRCCCARSMQVHTQVCHLLGEATQRVGVYCPKWRIVPLSETAGGGCL
jgi:hypothetical protein